MAYEGVAETLTELKRFGLKTAVYTSGSTYQIYRNLSAAGINVDDLFNGFVTADDGYASKPDPGGLLACANKLSVKPSECIFVGDHAVDMKCAKNAGFKLAVGVSHGFHEATELKAAGADLIIGSLPEMLG